MTSNEKKYIKNKAARALICCALCFAIVAGFAACKPKPKQPEPGTRVVVIDGVSLEILYRLGVEVIGVPSSGWEGIDAKYGDRTVYGDAGIPMQPNFTEIAMMNPSEVIMSDATEKAFGNIKSSFDALKIAVKFFSYNSVPELKDSIVEMGEFFGKRAAAEEIVAELNIKEADILARVNALSPKPKVMALFGAPLGTASQSISIATGGMYAGSIVGYSGAVNVIDALYPNKEFGLIKPDNWAPILDLEPDYIFCVAHGRPDEVWAMYDSVWGKTPWNLLRAVREGKIYYLPDDKVNVIAEFDYTEAMQYILDIFEGRVGAYGAGYLA
ncbi:MAG: ABC transporter substrate-binding protein [Clostridiales bacterium]|jgi:iron complex transport system substrate-binding protein|nr:ABC transporter substrate-binding protein [Clostridiales bacterium]